MTIAENRIDEILRFWFEELQPQDWFVRSEAVDRTIRARFLGVHDELSRGAELAVPASAREALAAVIVLDQFPRNLFRGSPRAFATDALALSLAQQAIAAGLDRKLSTQERMFLYMPFQHAEDRVVQERSVELFASLGAAESLDFARRHKEVIDRFGRFPHRNAALGRESTPQELEFMQQDPGF